MYIQTGKSKNRLEVSFKASWHKPLQNLIKVISFSNPIHFKRSYFQQKTQKIKFLWKVIKYRPYYHNLLCPIYVEENETRLSV